MPRNRRGCFSSKILRFPSRAARGAVGIHRGVSPDLGGHIAGAYNPERAGRDPQQRDDARGRKPAAQDGSLLALQGLLPWRYAADTLLAATLCRPRYRSIHSMTVPMLAGFDRNSYPPR